MAEYSAKATWEGRLREGHGNFVTGSHAVHGPVSYRVKEGEITDPEELTGAGLASCYVITLAKMLQLAGYEPKRVTAIAKLNMEKSGKEVTIASIALNAQAEVVAIGEEEFQKLARQAEAACPVSKALSGTSVQLDATLIG